MKVKQRIIDLERRVFMLENPHKFSKTEEVRFADSPSRPLLYRKAKIADVTLVCIDGEYYWKYELFIEGKGVIRYVREDDIKHKETS